LQKKSKARPPGKFAKVKIKIKKRTQTVYWVPVVSGILGWFRQFLMGRVEQRTSAKIKSTMISICFILFLLISILTQSYGQVTCASGWVQYGGNCYLIIPVFNSGSTTGSWDQCNAYCPTSYPGATMLCVQNAAENTWMGSQYGGWVSGPSGPGLNYWIGYTDMLPYGGGKGTKQYGWVTGCSSTYTNWLPGEPNNLNTEDYTEVNIYGQWNDRSQDDPKRCGCQYNPAPPSKAPTSRPTVSSSILPTTAPSSRPSTVPSSRPSIVSSSNPSILTSSRPSATPSSSPTVTPSSVPTAAPYELPSCPAGWTLHCGCQWSPPSSPRRFLQSAIYGVIHMHDYDRFAVGFMACLMMVMMFYFCMYVVGKVQRAYLVETATTTP
jgi:hypothetical protein